MSIVTGSPTADAVAFTIQELTGDQRTLVLTQRALPYRPIEFSGEQRAEFTAYPGNPIRTLQVFGAEEEPTEISGFWKERFIGQTAGASTVSQAYYTKDGQQTSLLTVIDLVNLADDIRRKGQRLLVQWGPEVRRGLLKRFSRKWHNIRDAEWTMRFEWTGQNEPDVPAVLAKDTDYANAQGTLQAKLQDMLTAIATATDIVSSKVEEFADLVTTMSDLVTQFAETTTNALDTTMPIMDQQRRLAGILTSVMDTSDTIVESATASPAVVWALPSSIGSPIEGPALAVEEFLRTMQDDARDMKYSAAQTQYDLLKSVNPNIVTVFTARDDTDLRDVSTKFYGSQDDWRSIMVFNDLDDSRLSSGDTVFVPQLYRPLDGSQ